MPMRLLILTLVTSTELANVAAQCQPGVPPPYQGPLNCTDRAPPEDPLVEEAPIDRGCKLVIVSAGMPRSGSTMQHKLLLAALKWMRIPAGDRYWNYHLHIQSQLSDDELRRRAAGLANTLRSLGNESVVIMKSHEYDGRLPRLCRRYIVFTVHRHPLDMVLSRAHQWGVRENTVWDVLRGDFDNDACWQRLSSEDTSNVELREDVEAVFDRYVAKIGRALFGQGYVDARGRADPAAKEEYVRSVRGNPSSRSKANAMGKYAWILDAKFRRRIHCYLRSYMDAYNYTA